MLHMTVKYFCQEQKVFLNNELPEWLSACVYLPVLTAVKQYVFVVLYQ